MKKISITKGIFWVFIFLLCNSVWAGGGMLIPSLLSAFESDMQAKGMKLSAEDIYSVNHASIKDAIIHFGGGCTASIISNKGLLLTNYHCGYYQIVSHSTLENNLAKNGFYAADFTDELKTGLTATRMVRIEDVTKKVLKGTEGLNDRDAYQKVLSNIALIKAEATEGTNFSADIKPFDFGNSYYLLVKEVFRDIRLVGAPPRAIGKFGGDLDNWVWPRHTGDFSLFRIYVNQNNQPADYSTNNIPYTPIHYLPISIRPKTDGEFTMVFGFPGITYQHTISDRMAFIINRLRPAQIKMRGLALSAINTAMEQSEKMKLMYAKKQSHTSNAWKKWQGQIEGLKIENAVAEKQAYEKAYIEKANGNAIWKSEYSKVIPALKQLTKKYANDEFRYKMYVGYTYVGAYLFDRARKFEEMLELYQKGEKEKLAKELETQQKALNGIFNGFDKNVDQQIFFLQTRFYKKIIDSNYQPLLLQKNTPKELQELIYSKSFLVNKEHCEKVLTHFDKYAKKGFKKDPGYQLYHQLKTIFKEKLLGNLRLYYGQKELLLKEYVKGKYDMYPNKLHWPDANNTLRLSYGKLEGAAPRDGVVYTSHTTVKGVISKYLSGKKEYELPQRFVDLYNQKDWGRYAQDGKLWTCFLSSNHTTGGNSGSPVIGAKGYLIGLNFDRNWEGTMSDFKFDASRCRNISVDIRYVLWLIDVYGKADRLINEMTIVDE